MSLRIAVLGALESAQILLLHLDLPLPTVMAAARIAKRKGALLVTENQHHQWRPLPRHPGDTTAAGDLFSAAFAVALAAGRTELASGRFALIAVSCMDKRLATAAQLPSLAEVERQWRHHLHSGLDSMVGVALG